MQSITGRVPVKRVMQLMFEGDSFVARGNYKPGTQGFTARVKASYGSFKLSGELAADASLHLTSVKTGGPRATGVYTFLPLYIPTSCPPQLGPTAPWAQGQKPFAGDLRGCTGMAWHGFHPRPSPFIPGQTPLFQ